MVEICWKSVNLNYIGLQMFFEVCIKQNEESRTSSKYISRHWDRRLNWLKPGTWNLYGDNCNYKGFSLLN